jgi:pimeloyl-ACP methyl ester carboxylesterase
MKVWTDPLAPTITVRWFFVPKDAPSLPFPTVFASRNWIRGEISPFPNLGEVEGATRQWVDGQGPGTALKGIPFGSAANFIDGAVGPPIPPLPPIWWGDAIPTAQTPFPVRPTLHEIGIKEPQVLFDLITALRVAYNGDSALTDRSIVQLVGGGASSFKFPTAVGQVPPMFAAWNARESVVVLAGSTTSYQILNIVLASATGPVEQGGFGSHPYVTSLVEEVSRRLTTGGLPTDRPVTFAGHSLGGMLASYLTARWRQLYPTIPSRLMTAAMPRWTDQRGSNLTSSGSVNLAAPTDPAPYFPLDVGFLAWLAPLVAAPLLAAWRQYRPPTELSNTIERGQLEVVDREYGPTGATLILLTQFLSGGITGWTSGHSVANYAQRLIDASFDYPETVPEGVIDLEELRLINAAL